MGRYFQQKTQNTHNRIHVFIWTMSKFPVCIFDRIEMNDVLQAMTEFQFSQENFYTPALCNICCMP